MPVTVQFREYVLEQLNRVTPVTARRMFGGLGLYSRDLFFALVDDDVLYLKVDDRNREDFERAGMRPFKPSAGKPTTMNYYELPAEVLEDEEKLKLWVNDSIRVAADKPRKPVASVQRRRKKTRQVKITRSGTRQ